MTSDERWLAVVARDPAWDEKFFYCVKTTKIFCRPTCKARLARRANVEFFTTSGEAQAAGYRPCKRCQPLLPSYTPEADKIKKVCDILDALPMTAPLPGLERLAGEAGLTKHHFHRLFKRETGLTPRQYAISSRRSDLGSESSNSAAMTPITPLTHDAETPMIFDDDLFDMPAMEPLLVADGKPLLETPMILDDDLFGMPEMEPLLVADGKPLSLDLDAFVVYYRILETTFGLLLIAFANHEVCKLELGLSEQELLNILEETFPSAYYLHSLVELAHGDDPILFEQRIAAVVEALENPTGRVLYLPTEVTGLDSISYMEEQVRGLRSVLSRRAASYEAW